MKNILLLIFLLASLPSFAQKPAQSNVLNIKYSPQHLFMEAHQVSFEYIYKQAKPQSLSLTLGRTYQNTETDRNRNSYAKLKGIYAALEHRYYFSGYSKNGFYIAPSIKFEYLSADFSTPVVVGLSLDSAGTEPDGIYLKNVQNVHSFTAAYTIGFQYVFLKYILIDIYAGLGYRYSYSTFNYPKDQGMLYPMWRPKSEWLEATFDRAYTGLLPKLGFQIGVAF